jgi:hypothetical protein
VFFKHYDTLDQKTHTAKYEAAMARLHEQYPEDTEAAVFYALALNEAAIWRTTLIRVSADRHRGRIFCDDKTISDLQAASSRKRGIKLPTAHARWYARDGAAVP